MPKAGQSQLYREFMDLKQGNITFAEYERKFDELSQYGPSMIDTPLKKNKKFIHGARPEYYDRLVNHVHGTFTNLIDMASRFESPANQGKQAVASSQSQGASNDSKKRKPRFQQQKKNWQNTHGIGYFPRGSSRTYPPSLSSGVIRKDTILAAVLVVSPFLQLSRSGTTSVTFASSSDILRRIAPVSRRAGLLEFFL